MEARYASLAEVLAESDYVSIRLRADGGDAGTDLALPNSARCGKGRSWSIPRAGRLWISRRSRRPCATARWTAAGLDVFDGVSRYGPTSAARRSTTWRWPRISGARRTALCARMAELAAQGLLDALEGRRPDRIRSTRRCGGRLGRAFLTPLCDRAHR